MSNIISKEKENMVEELFNLLQHAETSPDYLLPNTGVTLEWERILSPDVHQKQRLWNKKFYGIINDR